MSFWNGDHPLQWKYQQVEKALPAFGASDNENFSDSTNEDLTEAANLICLVYDYYNNGSLAANIEVRLSRYLEECKYGAQMFKDTFGQVMYWYENDRMPTDEEQEWYCTDWIRSMLVSIDFEYDESKNPAAPEPPKPPKRKRDELNETEAKAKLDQMFKVARAEPAKKRRVTKPYKCSKCGQPKKGHTCKVPKVPVALAPAPEPEPEPEPEFAVTRADFMQYKAYQRCSANGLPQWFMTDDAKASEVMNRYDQLAAYYKLCGEESMDQR
tara:strand:+ start:6622 stop:7428 length:807 start_codon:yes stop_codon:yes gene_type:complete